MPLPTLRKYIAKHHHLPNIPSAKEVEAEGKINVNKLQISLLEKVEELTLYNLQLLERIERLKKSTGKGKNSKKRRWKKSRR